MAHDRQNRLPSFECFSNVCRHVPKWIEMDSRILEECVDLGVHARQSIQTSLDDCKSGEDDGDDHTYDDAQNRSFVHSHPPDISTDSHKY
jgi:hypothetical protein